MMASSFSSLFGGSESSKNNALTTKNNNNSAPPDGGVGNTRTNNPYQTLPPGWETATDPNDGRIYYWHKASGKSSWRHPLAPDDHGQASSSSTPPPPPPPSGMTTSKDLQSIQNDYYYQDTARNAGRRPDNHQCYAFCSLLLFPPIGLIAMYHSYKVDSCWTDEQFGQAVSHSRQAPKYACFANVVGIVMWIWILFFRGPEGGGGGDFRWEWPDWGNK